jgi:hypothetical protein
LRTHTQTKRKNILNSKKKRIGLVLYRVKFIEFLLSSVSKSLKKRHIVIRLIIMQSDFFTVKKTDMYRKFIERAPKRTNDLIKSS